MKSLLEPEEMVAASKESPEKDSTAVKSSSSDTFSIVYSIAKKIVTVGIIYFVGYMGWSVAWLIGELYFFKINIYCVLGNYKRFVLDKIIYIQDLFSCISNSKVYIADKYLIRKILIIFLFLKFCYELVSFNCI